MKRTLMVLVVIALMAAVAGCGTLYPRSTITGGDATGSINRDEMLDVEIEPIRPVPEPAPAPEQPDGELVVEILEEGN